MADIEMVIQKLVFGGDGLGFVNGKVCFVEETLAGEKILAQIQSEKKNYAKAKLLKILEPSPQRIEPPCPYIKDCAGCQYQHMTYPEELHWKENQVRESFKQGLKLDDALIAPIQSGEKFYGYRTSVTLHRTTNRSEESQRLGFVGRDNRSVIAIDHCLLAGDPLRPVFQSAHRMHPGEKDRSFKISANQEIVSSEKTETYSVQIGNETLWTSSAGFFQTNPAVTELVVKQVARYVTDIQPKRFIDLYAGVGTFSLAAAKNVPHIICFEENQNSIDCLRKNFSEKRIPLAGALQGRVEKTFPFFISTYQKPETLILMDPPRQGLETSLARFFAQKESADHILYLACDLAILIRDLKILLGENRWQISSVVPFDMFPRTKHIETLVHLIKKS